MKKYVFMVVVCLCSAAAMAAGPWKFKAENKEQGLTLDVDLYEESIDVPGYEWFGPLNGYLEGKGIYGVWAVTSVQSLSDKEAVVHFSNDLGSDTQAVRMTLKNDSVLLFEQTGGTTMKRVVNKKLVKIPQSFTLKIKGDR